MRRRISSRLAAVARDGFRERRHDLVGAPVEARDPLNPDRQTTVDGIAIITVHDGPSLPPGEIIAPSVGNERTDPHYHNNFQDPEAFLRSEDCRGPPAGAGRAGTRSHRRR